MGLAFLLTQMIEYAHVGFNTSDGAFASVFFGLTGLHGAHVFVGLTLLTDRGRTRFPRALLARAPPRRRDPRDLLALRRHHVDRRLHGGVPALERIRRRRTRAKKKNYVPKSRLDLPPGGRNGEEPASATRPRLSSSSSLSIGYFGADRSRLVDLDLARDRGLRRAHRGRVDRAPRRSRAPPNREVASSGPRSRTRGDPGRRQRDGRRSGAAPLVQEACRGTRRRRSLVCPALNSRAPHLDLGRGRRTGCGTGAASTRASSGSPPPGLGARRDRRRRSGAGDRGCAAYVPRRRDRASRRIRPAAPTGSSEELSGGARPLRRARDARCRGSSSARLRLYRARRSVTRRLGAAYEPATVETYSATASISASLELALERRHRARAVRDAVDRRAASRASRRRGSADRAGRCLRRRACGSLPQPALAKTCLPSSCPPPPPGGSGLGFGGPLSPPRPATEAT